MLTESTKKMRDPLAFALLGATVLYLVASVALLFKSDVDFADKAALFSGQFLNPVWALVVLVAVALVTAGGASSAARTVTMLGLAVIGVQLALGLVTWLVGLGANSGGGVLGEFFGGDIGVGKAAGSFIALASVGVLAIAALVVFNVFRSLPAPVRQQPQQQWGGQQQGGQPWGQQQWGQQPGHPGQHPGQQPGQWGAPAAGAAGGAAAGAAAWGQPETPSGQSSSGYAAGGDPGYAAPQGYEDPYAAGSQQTVGPYSSDPYSSDPYAGQPAQQQWGQPPQQSEQQQWGQPPQQSEQQQWGQPEQPSEPQPWGQPPQQSEPQPWGQPEQPAPEQSWGQPTEQPVDPDATQYYGTVAEPHTPEGTPAPEQEPSPSSAPEAEEQDDDERPGWWAPGS